MKIACLAALASLRAAFLFTALASFAGAQNQTWIRQFGTTIGEVASASAPDGSGGVYVSGGTGGSLGGPNAGGSDVWLAHYDGAGGQTWIRQFGSSDNEVTFVAAPDGSGGVYIGGQTTGSLGGPHTGGGDAWLAHCDGAGSQTWVRQFGTVGDDFLTAAVPDGVGGLYVSGSTQGSLGGPNAGSWDAWLAHFDSAGNQAWIRQFGTVGDDFAGCATADGSGGVYVGGSTRGSLGGPNAGAYDAWVAHYDSLGNQTRIRQFGSAHSDSVVATAPDGSGGVYVSGLTQGSLGGPNAGGRDAWLAHYDGAGNQTWVRQFGTTSNDDTYAAAPDGAGGVYVGGATDGSLGGPQAGIWDAWLAHYDGTGHQTWIRQFGTNNYDYVCATAPDGAGGVYVSGYTGGSLGGPHAGGSDVWLAHYGNLITHYCTPAVPNSTGQPGVLTATGSVVIAANDFTVEASQLSLNSFGFFLTSRMQGLVMQPGGSQGNLCLGGAIGRYVGPGQIQNAGSAGAFSLALDLTMAPTPTGFVAVQPGDTWNFQAWYRDANPTATSNFTDAVSVTFL